MFFFSYLALYFVDVVASTEAQAGIAVTVWLAMGLITDFLFIPFIDRQSDIMKFLRSTALLEVICLFCFSADPRFHSQTDHCRCLRQPVQHGLVSHFAGRLYSSLPGQSASIMAIGSVTTPLAKLLPFLIGFLADQFGLQTRHVALVLGPLALLIGLPRHTISNPDT